MVKTTSKIMDLICRRAFDLELRHILDQTIETVLRDRYKNLTQTEKLDIVRNKADREYVYCNARIEAEKIIKKSKGTIFLFQDKK